MWPIGWLRSIQFYTLFPTKLSPTHILIELWLKMSDIFLYITIIFTFLVLTKAFVLEKSLSCLLIQINTYFKKSVLYNYPKYTCWKKCHAIINFKFTIFISIFFFGLSLSENNHNLVFYMLYKGYMEKNAPIVNIKFIKIILCL